MRSTCLLIDKSNNWQVQITANHLLCSYDLSQNQRSELTQDHLVPLIEDRLALCDAIGTPLLVTFPL